MTVPLDPQRTLIFEADPRGHAFEWLCHILHAARHRSDAERLTLVVDPRLLDPLSNVAGETVDLVPLTPLERRLCGSGPAFLRGLMKWGVVRRHASKSSAGRIFLLGLDHFLAPLALGLSFRYRPVSGILFRPTAHYGEFRVRNESVRDRVRRSIKRFLTRRALKNPDLACILSLDPYFPAYAENYLESGTSIAGLYDPAPNHGPGCAPVLNRKTDKKSFLLFGEITDRKGVLQTIRALALLPEEVVRKVGVTIAGRVDPAIASTFYQELRALEWARPELSLRIEDGWVADADLTRLLDEADVVLVPYQRFVGSSGVLIRAAQHGKPVICQDYGLLGRFVQDFELGTVTDTCDSRALSKCIEQVALDVLPGFGLGARYTEFLAGREAEEFGARVLDTVFSAALREPPVKPETSGKRIISTVEKMVTDIPRMVTRSVARLVK